MQTKNWLWFCLLLSILVSSGLGQNAVLVKKAAISSEVNGNDLVIALPIAGTGSAPDDIRVTGEILDPKNRVLISSSPSTQATSSKNILLHFNLTGIDMDGLVWARLHYHVLRAAKPVAEDTIALARIIPTEFQLRLVLPRAATSGEKFPFQVMAANPVTLEPVAGVKLHAKMSVLDGSGKGLLSEAFGTTSKAGLALMTLEVPVGLKDENLELNVSGSRGPSARAVTQDVDVFNPIRLNVQTDKPIYQPGQTLHTRVVALTRDAALKSMPVRFTFLDPEQEEVYRVVAETNQYGIASADWPIPAELRLGDYSIQAQLTDFPERNTALGRTDVRISRYDLPQFSVTASSDKPYYLPGEQPEIQVQAKYLFGKPLKHGKVRVVRERDRSWSYSEQKWEVEEAEQHNGVLGSDGSFRAKFALEEDFEDLTDDHYRRFLDVDLAAYVTDESTGRTEQRRFKVRLSRQRIHLYLEVLNRGTAKQGWDVAVISSYADGTPAVCDVQIGDATDSDVSEDEESPDTFIDQRILAKVRTNQYGVAIARDLRLANPDDEPSDGSGRAVFVLTARDRKGIRARHVESEWFRDRASLRLTTDKAIYRPEETVHITLRSDGNVKRAGILIMQDGKVLRSETLKPSHGYALFNIPYRESMKGEVQIVAYSLDDFNAEAYDIDTAQKTVLFPVDRSLKVKVSGLRSTYAPGDEVVADIRVREADFRSHPSALGVLVIDEAVRERAATDKEFGNQGFDWDWWWSEYPTFGSLTRESLDKLNTGFPIPDDVQETAEVILNGGSRYWYWNFGLRLSDMDLKREIRTAFESGMKKQVQPIRDAVRLVKQDTGLAKSADDITRKLATAGIDLGEYLDPWGNRYKLDFRTQYTDSVLELISAGPDEEFGTDDDLIPLREEWNYLQPIGPVLQEVVSSYYAETGRLIRNFETLRAEALKRGLDLNRITTPDGDSFNYEFPIANARAEVHIISNKLTYWTASVDYFSKLRKQIGDALWRSRMESGASPRTDRDFDQVLRKYGMDPGLLRDRWDRPYQVKFAEVTRFGDSVQVSYEATAQYQSAPVTVSALATYIQSLGEDGIPGDKDDFVVASYYEPITEQSGKDATQRALKTTGPMSNGLGVATGVVVDPSQAVIPGARITAKNETTEQSYSTTTDESGRFLLANIEAGSYTFTIQSTGFLRTVVRNVPVRSTSVVEVNAMLRIGAAAETVEVTADAGTVNTTSATLMSLKSLPLGLSRQAAPIKNFTPRLRQYFPETLYWQPFVETDKNGRASVRFKLADNIGTWHLAVLASSKRGEIGEKEVDFQSFQPFFAELDPPQVLTVGDKISLAVPLRNYLDRAQTVSVSMRPQDWFALSGPAEQRLSVPAADSVNAVFELSALRQIDKGKQLITAANQQTGDSIQREVHVHPFGEDRTLAAGAILRADADLELDLPQQMIPGTLTTELKVYPNLISHVVESVEGIMRRPYGCAEQTISSSYPSLLLLKHFGSKVPANLALTAKGYLLAGYRKLLRYRNDEGAFTYWSGGDPDPALTAYALRFLTEAQGLIDVNPDVLEQAKKWLTSHGEPAAIGPGGTHWTLLNMAYRTRVLASMMGPKPAQNDPLAGVVNRNLDYLEENALRTGDPYLLATYILAASDAGRKERALKTAESLRQIMKHQGSMGYWNLESNTPFYGWGYTGRLETTALVLQALHRVRVDQRASGEDKVADAGLLFLLKSQDEYGMWYSTQATINALEAIVAWGRSEQISAANKAALVVNGKPAGTIELPSGDEVGAPMLLQITGLAPGKNLISLRRSNGGPAATLQVVSHFFRPWTSEELKARSATSTGESSGLHLTVDYDKKTAKAGEDVRCTVEVERFGYSGYGMLIAEIGLPPGVDVSRQSLESAMAEVGWSFSHYEILPDRVVAYLWPWHNKVRFTFSFRPRLVMDAESAQSEVYDYYNPEAHAVLAPIHFTSLPSAVQQAQQVPAPK